MKIFNEVRGTATAVLAALALFSLPAEAAPLFFSSQEAFDEAVANAGISLTIDSYEDLPQGWVFGALERDSYKVLNAGNQVFVVDNVLNATDGTKSLVMGVPAKPVTFEFGAAIQAFSIDAVDGLSISGGDFTVEIDGGPAQTILSGHFGSRDRQFLGVLDLDGSFGRLTFNNTDIADTWTFDRARFGAATPAPVPEPSAWILAGTGIALVFARRLRRA